MDFFEFGAKWLRADFHLHTKADKEFQYSGVENDFVKDYISALVVKEIHVGVIANHNKFDSDEFKALSKAARAENICLLPGVELSVGDGTNGVHTIIVFSNEWLVGDNYIGRFLDQAFVNTPQEQYENGNANTQMNISGIIDLLDGYQKDYFIVFPHVEQNKGFWKELGGARITELGQSQEFKDRTLAFQKVRTHNKTNVPSREQVKIWLGDWYPAEVEGSDPKKIVEIGNGKQSYIKIGAFTFESIRLALRIHEFRPITQNPPKISHSYISQVTYIGGTLDGETVKFSPELNTIIGIRGSGKSSIIETIRYALGINKEEDESDFVYKTKLVEWTLGNGGQVLVDAVDKYGEPYQIKRILNEQPLVYMNGKQRPGVTIRETVIKNPLVFGQKELTDTKQGAEASLINELVGLKLVEIQGEITKQKDKVIESLDKLSKSKNVEEQINGQEIIRDDAKHVIDFYNSHGFAERLQERLGLDEDIRKSSRSIEVIEELLIDLKQSILDHKDMLTSLTGFTSKDNAEFFKLHDERIDEINSSVRLIDLEIAKIEGIKEAMVKSHNELLAYRDNKLEDFATIERKLVEESRALGMMNINTDAYLSATKRYANAELSIEALTKEQAKVSENEATLDRELVGLQDLWRQEYEIIKDELDAASLNDNGLSFSIEYQGDTEKYLGYFNEIIKKSEIREDRKKEVISKYPDFISIYRDIEEASKLFRSNPTNGRMAFEQNLKNLLVYQTPNKIVIRYRDVELARHSLGQRASALMLFVLSHQDNDVIIIDQPEDDLDNQTIYKDVIQLIQKLKPDKQFIFATHNPNFPVLGDAEQIHACELTDNKISIQSGSIDDTAQQDRVIDIMEGGEQAFKLRKDLYEKWKS